MFNIWVFLSSFLVMGMYLAADMIGSKDVIFPVLSALVTGVWVIGNPVWTKNIFLIWFSPTAAAVTGFIFNSFLQFNIFLSIFIILFFAAIQLLLFRSDVAPSIAIMILPIFLDLDSWYYVFSVCGFTMVIACVHWLRNRIHPPQGNSQLVREQTHEDKKEKLIQWVYVIVGVSILLVISFLTKWLFIVVPPLIVTFFELWRAKSPLKNRLIKLGLLMIISAFSGTLMIQLLFYYLQLPLWLSAGIIVLWIIILFEYLKISFAPATAIALLPTLVPVAELWSYPIQVTVGVVLFLVIGKAMLILSKKYKKENTNSKVERNFSG
jgi:hypothetical protein